VKDRRGQSSRTRDKEDLQPNDRGTPSHKYAPALAPINVNLAATIKFGKREFPSLPLKPREQKNQAPDFSEARSFTLRTRLHPPVAAIHSSHFLEGGSMSAISARCSVSSRYSIPMSRASLSTKHPWAGCLMLKGFVIAVSQVDQYCCHAKYTDGAMAMLRQIRHSVRV
jgi:hypothetical protein